jgi:hypothetical protein
VFKCFCERILTDGLAVLFYAVRFPKEIGDIDLTTMQASVCNSVISIICWYGSFLDGLIFGHPLKLARTVFRRVRILLALRDRYSVTVDSMVK